MPPTPCIVCHRTSTTEQTCARCLGHTRTDLNWVADLYALLPAELNGHGAAATPMDPSGVRGTNEGLLDALVLLAAGTAGTVTASQLGDRSHAMDQLPTDPPAVVAALGFWEDDWRECRELRPAMKEATVTGCTLFLQQNLTWAADKHPAFDEFAADIRKLRAQLEVVMRTRLPYEMPAIACPDCGGHLLKRYRRPDPCPPGCTHQGEGHDQGGRRDDWHCADRHGCGRVVTVAEYWLHVRDRWDREQVVTA